MGVAVAMAAARYQVRLRCSDPNKVAGRDGGPYAAMQRPCAAAACCFAALAVAHALAVASGLRRRRMAAASALLRLSKAGAVPSASCFLLACGLMPCAPCATSRQVAVTALLLLCAGAHAMTTMTDPPNNNFPGGNVVFNLQNSTVTPGVVTICMCVPPSQPKAAASRRQRR